jgi:AraC family transcriptional regulator
MDWLEKMNGAIQYLEDHLLDEIDYDEVAKRAWCSSYHFQRMFSFITDVSVSEYVRRRRLTLAAFELQKKDVKVIDLSLKYGYDSPVSFARAFQNLHGTTPTLARDKGVTLKAFPKLSFHISIKGDVEMNYRIEEKEKFRVFGVEKTVDSTNGNNFIIIPKFWQDSFADGTVDRLSKIPVNNSPKGLGCVNAIMCYGDMTPDAFQYMIGVIDFAGDASIPSEMAVVDVASFTWAIFTTEVHKPNETTEKIQALWQRIFSEWFPTAGYEHAAGPELELYYMPDENSSYSEVWIPVVKK